MRWIYKLPLRLRSLFGKTWVERELSEELRFHLEKLTEDKIAQGITPEEAHYIARRELGGVEQIKEECREMRRINFIEDLLKDLRFGLRQLRRNPGFTAVAIITLALGIGANSAVFSVVDGILLRPLPYKNPDRLVSVWQTQAPKGVFPAIREASRTLDVAAYSWPSGVNLVTGRGQPARVIRSEVSVSLFHVLGIRAALGRTFKASEDLPGRNKVVILSNALWNGRFGSDPHIIGRWIRLNDSSWEVIGVMPAGVTFPSYATQLWTPIELSPSSLWGNFSYMMIARLRPGSTLAAARAELKTLTPRVVSLMPWPMPHDWAAGVTDVLPLQKASVVYVQSKLLILLAAVGLVLLMACSNVANLMLARSAGRRREMALRAALGASQGRVIRQLITEGTLLAMAGGSLGLALAFQGLLILKAILPENTPRLASVSINWQVLVFTLLICVIAGLVFGLAPALSASKCDLEQELKTASGRTGLARGQRRVSSVLVAAEIAVQVIVLVGAALLLRSFWTLTERNPGFQAARLLTAHVDQINSRCKATTGCVNFYAQLLRRLSALPGVRGAAAATGVPSAGVYPSVFSIEGHPLSINGSRPLSAWLNVVTPGYLRALGVPLLRGRAFTDSDRVGQQPVALVSASAARRWWPDGDPIGKRIKFSWMRDDWRTVVGVVADVRESGLADPFAWEAGADGDVYIPYAQGAIRPGSPPNMTLVIRTRENPDTTATALRAVVAGVDSAVPVSELQTMDRVLSESIAEPRSTTLLFLCFAILSLVLGTIGVYGVVSYSVACRTAEFAVRMALGATKQMVMRMVLNEGSKLACGGVIIGVLCALVLSQVMSGLLFGVKPHDWISFVCAAALTLIVAVLACYIPARRAMKVDPTVALRHE